MASGNHIENTLSKIHFMILLMPFLTKLCQRLRKNKLEYEKLSHEQCIEATNSFHSTGYCLQNIAI